MKKIISGIFWPTLIIGIILCRFVFGVHAYAILSGSMEPKYPVKSLVVTREVPPEELKKGDVITFMLDESTIVTHRIHKVTHEDGKLRFVTKGDANRDPDGSKVLAGNVIGKAVFCVPHLGYIITVAKRPPYLYILIGVAAMVLVWSFWPEEEEKKDEKPIKKETRRKNRIHTK